LEGVVDLGEILRVMRSRWYIVVPMLLLAVGLGVGAYVKVPTTYTTYTTVSLLSSPAATVTATPGQDNPFLNFNSSLVATADFLGRRLQSTDVQAELRKVGVTEKYEVALAENAQGPFLTFTVTGNNKDHMLATAATIARYADVKLIQIQDENGVKTRDMIRLTQIIPPQRPQAELKSKLELVIAAVGGTVALAFILTFVVESVSRARRRRALSQETTEPSTKAAEDEQIQPVAVAVELVEAAAATGSAAVIAMPMHRDRPRQHPDGTVRPNGVARVPRQPGTAASGKASPGKGVAAPVTGTRSGASGTTYHSQSADPKGHDAADRVNGS
jgi:hypothetical protein